MYRSILMLLGLAVVSIAQDLRAADPPAKSDCESATINVEGTLRTDIFVIGGETTGVVVQSKGNTWELDFGKSVELKKTAEKLCGKRVAVEGHLEYRCGVEVKDRWVIIVATVRPLNE